MSKPLSQRRRRKSGKPARKVRVNQNARFRCVSVRRAFPAVIQGCAILFSEEIARIQYAYRSFVAVLGDNGESHLALLDIKHRIAVCALSVNRLLLLKT